MNELDPNESSNLYFCQTLVIFEEAIKQRHRHSEEAMKFMNLLTGREENVMKKIRYRDKLDKSQRERK
jgi:hypothetical protein